jgi:phosphopantetheine--protein transferase-like protein
VGIDLVAVDDVHDSMRTHGDRWLQRVFTERELRECGAGRGAARALAARFAAKEATLKVLGDPGEPVPWRDIEVRRAAAGAAVQLRLAGAAERSAAATGLDGFTLSLTHRDGLAAAVVIAQTARAAPPPTPSRRSSRSAPEPMNPPVNEEIRRVLAQHARLSADVATLPDDADLYEAGMTSHASVNVMLALEDAFDVEFPDRLLKRSVFESVSAIATALAELEQEAA